MNFLKLAEKYKNSTGHSMIVQLDLHNSQRREREKHDSARGAVVVCKPGGREIVLLGV